jgi:hypothetical protein
MRSLQQSQYNRAVSRHIAAIAVMLLGVAANAHDLWIEPRPFRPSPGTQVPLKLLYGVDFGGESLLYNPDQFERYIYAGPAGVQPVPGKLGNDPAGHLPTAGPGLYAVGHCRHGGVLKFESAAAYEEKTESALKDPERFRGLTARKRLSLIKSIVEIYRPCTKALVLVGASTAEPADRVLGFPLELVAQNTPYGIDPMIDLQLLYRGKPLEGALVVAFSQRDPLAKIQMRTDKSGRVSLRLTRGIWLVKSANIVPTSLLSRADFERFVTSLTFERP